MADVVFKKEHKVSNARMINMPGHHTSAGISYYLNMSVKCDSCVKPHPYIDIDGSINITDCFKGVSLDLSAAGGVHEHYRNNAREELDNAVFKVDSLLEVLNEVKNHLVKGYEYIEEGEKIYAATTTPTEPDIIVSADELIADIKKKQEEEKNAIINEQSDTSSVSE